MLPMPNIIHDIIVIFGVFSFVLQSAVFSLNGFDFDSVFSYF